MSFINPETARANDCAECGGALGDADRSKLHCYPVYASPIIVVDGMEAAGPVGVEAWRYFCPKCTALVPETERCYHSQLTESAA